MSEFGGSKSYEVLLRGSSVEPQTTAMDDKYVYNNEVLLRVTNHTGQAEKNLLGPAGIRTRDLRLLVRCSTN